MADMSPDEQKLLRMAQGQKADASMPDNAAAPPDTGLVRGLLSALSDAGVGAMKGAGETAVNLGSMVNKVPGVGDVTQGLGNALGGLYGTMKYGTAAGPADRSSFDTVRRSDTTPTNAAQSTGKTIEQIGEFFVPGSAATKALKSASVASVPATAWPMMSALLEAAGEGGTAAAVSSMHGEENPDTEAGLAAGTSLASNALAPGAAKLLEVIARSPLLKGLVPILAGGAALSSFGVRRAIRGRSEGVLIRVG